jgi:hypothetical protein
MINEVRAYLDLLDQPPEDEAARLDALAEALDRLTVAYHETEDLETEGSVEAPKIDYSGLRKTLAPRFPELGLYAAISPGPPDKLEALVSDAIDDLVDVARDLMRVDWLTAHGHQDEAVWDFRYNFEIHWGRHLLDLRSHIHRLRHGF